MIHWGRIFCFLQCLLEMVRKNLLKSRMVYDPFGNNLLLASWLTGDGKEKVAEEYGDGQYNDPTE